MGTNVVIAKANLHKLFSQFTTKLRTAEGGLSAVPFRCYIELVVL